MKADPTVQPLQDVMLAFALLSRLPMPRLPDQAFAQGARAVWAYPVVGLVLGGVAVFLSWGAMGLGVPSGVAAGLGLALLMLLSGAMHEDGLADTVDGFWGGHDPARRLEIMNDSQIGTYGVLALIVVTGVRWLTFATLLPVAPLALVACCVVSRGMMAPVMAALPHARPTGLAQSVGRPSAVLAGLGVAVSVVVAIVLTGPVAFVLAGLGLIAATVIGYVAQAKIGGHTGDILGAVQQISELVMLVILASVLGA